MSLTGLNMTSRLMSIEIKFANNAWNPLMKDSKWHLSSNESQTRYAWLPIVGFNDNHNESLNQLFLDLFCNSISCIVLIIRHL